MRNKFHCSAAVTLIVLMITQSAFAQSQASTATLPTAAPSAVGMSPTQLTYIDQIVEAEIAKKQLPGAVVLVGRQGKIVWRRAYGNRALEPQPEPMTVDTIFDLASLTKIVATATSVMILVDRLLFRLFYSVSR
jgi:CubicO group peptidase (beta-lactamase class C family)